MKRRLATPLVLAAIVVSVVACSSSHRVGDASSTVGTSTTLPAESTVPGTGTGTGTDAATSTVASTSTSSTSTSTTTPAPAPLVLRSDGVGAFALGAEVADVVDGISAQLGGTVTDETRAYPSADGLGQYQTADGEFGFVAPVGRSVCWSVQLCAEFGGATGAAMSFTGWSYRTDPTHALHSPSGVTLDMRLSDAPTIRADVGGCYSVGSGQVDGIRLTLESSGEPFGSFDESGNYVSKVPNPADVTVTWMEAGEVPVSLYGDC